MAALRRNAISYVEERIVSGVAAASGVLALLPGTSPTGSTPTDVLVTAVFAAFVTWAGASAPWWALLAAAGIGLAGALSGPLPVVLLAIAAMAGATWIGLQRANQPVARAVLAGAIVQVVLRLEWDPFFFASGLLALGATGLIAVQGVLRRRRYLRRRAYWGLAGTGVFCVLAIAGLGVAALQGRTAARDGYTGMLDGLEFVQSGQVPEAAAALRTAAADLDDASGTIGGPFGQLARFVPGVAQNRNASTEVLARASAAADAAAATLDVVDLDQLTVRQGVVDVAAFAALAPPLDALDATIAELDDALRDAESPWLIAPFANRLDESIDRADQVAHQSRATAAAAEIAPAMLGADGPRRYFLAFVNPAEARGLNGLMGNWNEITIDDGRLEVTATGRTNDLQEPSLRELELEASEEYIDRYQYYGARASRGVALKYWSNVTMAPDMPSVGNAMAQMYEQVTGRPVDGVFVIDPTGIASLLEITGPVTLPDIDVRLDSSNAADFLQLGQYEFAENEREDLLAAVTDETIDNVLNGDLPAPQLMAPILAPSVLNGHITGWAVRPDEQELFRLVGMDGALPVVGVSGMDALSIANNNASGNKIESFLERRVEYRPVVDQSSGEATATLRIELTNNAPRTGFEEYVIGNLVDLPTGTNRMLVDVYTRLAVETITVDGVQRPPNRLPELGYWVQSVMFDVAPGATGVLEMELAGDLGPGPYQLAYRPQPLANSETLVVEARSDGGGLLFEFDGELERRSVLDQDGVRAWR